jgi:hypothetical protein
MKVAARCEVLPGWQDLLISEVLLGKEDLLRGN